MPRTDGPQEALRGLAVALYMLIGAGLVWGTFLVFPSTRRDPVGTVQLVAAALGILLAFAVLDLVVMVYRARKSRRAPDARI